jgi:hypothetical protein
LIWPPDRIIYRWETVATFNFPPTSRHDLYTTLDFLAEQSIQFENNPDILDNAVYEHLDRLKSMDGGPPADFIQSIFERFRHEHDADVTSEFMRKLRRLSATTR